MELKSIVWGAKSDFLFAKKKRLEMITRGWWSVIMWWSKRVFWVFFFWHLYGIYRRDVWCVYIILWIWRGKQRTYLSTDGYTYLQRSFKYLGLFVSVRFFTLGYLSLSGILDRRGNRKVWGGFRCWTFIDIIWDSLDFWEKDLSQWPHHKWLRI